MHQFGGTILVLLFAIEGIHAALNAAQFAKWKPTAANWGKFKSSHDRQFKSSRDETARRKLWEDCQRTITDHNTEELLTGKHGFVLGSNKFCDMTLNEVKPYKSGRLSKPAPEDWTDPAPEESGQTPDEPDQTTEEPDYQPVDEYAKRNGKFHSGRTRRATAPASINWVTNGAVTAVQDQRSCVGCWSFSATGAVEGAYFVKYGTLVKVSEQQLIDCSSSFGNAGCSGGLEYWGFAYLKTVAAGLASDYPFEGVTKTCRYNASLQHINSLKGIGYIQSGNETALKQAVGTLGPISAGMDASLKSFELYSGGVYNDAACSSTYLDHSVLVVGYGTDATAGDYWLVKNSWGTSWGEAGYFRVARNRGNRCGLATDASYPKF